MPRLPFTFGLRSGTAPSTDLPLLQPGDLTYIGAQKYPHSPTSTYNGGGKVIAYSGTSGAFGVGSLYVSGHDYGPLGGEVNLRVPVIGNTLSQLPSMTLAQGPNEGIDIYGGQFESAGSALPLVQGGIQPWTGNKLILSNYVYYDGPYSGYKSHFVRSTTLSDPTISTPTGINAPGLGFVPGASGWYGQTMCPIPAAWQSALGGTLLCSGYGMSVSGRTSNGPDCFVVNGDDFINGIAPVPGIRLLGYPDAHQTLTEVAPNDIYSNVWNLGSQQFNGMIFPDNTSTICYFAGHGYGAPETIKELPSFTPAPYAIGDPFRYGEGVTNQAISGRIKSQDIPKKSVDYYYYDPANLSKGYHGYPYRQNVWMYDVRDLLKVKNGDTNPATGQPYNYWEVTPYYSGTFGNVTIPFQGVAARIYGATYDPSRKRIYLSCQGTDGGYPIIHALTIPY